MSDEENNQGIQPAGESSAELSLPESESTGKWYPRAKAFLLFLVSFFCAILANNICGKIGFKVAPRHPLLADTLYRVLTTIAMLLVYSAMLRYLDRERGSTLAAMGLPLRKGWLRESLLGVAIAFGLITLAVSAIAVFGHIEMHTALNGVAVRRLVEVTILLLFGAIMEELMFRGYPFQRLVDAVGKTGAILLFSALFGYVHLNNPNAGGFLSWGFFNTIAVGVVFAIAYLKFRTLWLPWGMHFGWNFSLGVVYGLPVSGLSLFSVVIKSSATGPALLTGGAYGIEASLTGAVAIVVGLAVVLALPGPRNTVLPFRLQSPLIELSPQRPNGI